MLIDIHTHIPAHQSPNLCFLVGKHSLGIHPWELSLESSKETIDQNLAQMRSQYCKEVLAIGECGLDRAREGIAPIEFQLEVLEKHLDWARQVNRPVIVHCVRAHSDFLMLLRKKRYEGKILLHDYAGNLDEALKFLKYDVYFSFGARLLNEKSKASAVFKMLPREKLFLETDDQSEWSIEKIYQRAENILKLDRTSLEKLFYENLLNFFGDLKDVSASDLITLLS